MSYATIANLTDRYDSRVVNQLSNDAGLAVAVTSVIQAALDDATATLRIAAMQGGIYTSDELDLLATNADAAMIRIVCDVAYKNMATHRGMGLDGAIAQQVKDTLETLDLIRKGVRVFDVAINRQAEQPEVISLSPSQLINQQSLTATSFFNVYPQNPPQI